MKRTDWAIIILVMVVVGVISLLFVSLLISAPKDHPETVRTAERITGDVESPDPAVFSSKSINPTVKVKIGDQSGSQPFSIGD